jgi:hypothetical protein
MAPQKKMTSSLLTSSVVASGVVGSEEAGETGGSDVPPNLKASGGVAAGAGLGAGKQGSGRELGVVTGVSDATTNSGWAHNGQWLGSPEAGADPWAAGRTGLSERRFRDALSSLPMNLLRSSCCFRSKDAGRGKALGPGSMPSGGVGLPYSYFRVGTR